MGDLPPRGGLPLNGEKRHEIDRTAKPSPFPGSELRQAVTIKSQSNVLTARLCKRTTEERLHFDGHSDLAKDDGMARYFRVPCQFSTGSAARMAGRCPALSQIERRRFLAHDQHGCAYRRARIGFRHDLQHAHVGVPAVHMRRPDHVGLFLGPRDRGLRQLRCQYRDDAAASNPVFHLYPADLVAQYHHPRPQHHHLPSRPLDLRQVRQFRRTIGHSRLHPGVGQPALGWSFWRFCARAIAI